MWALPGWLRTVCWVIVGFGIIYFGWFIHKKQKTIRKDVNERIAAVDRFEEKEEEKCQ